MPVLSVIMSMLLLGGAATDHAVLAKAFAKRGGYELLPAKGDEDSPYRRLALSGWTGAACRSEVAVSSGGAAAPTLVIDWSLVQVPRYSAGPDGLALVLDGRPGGVCPRGENRCGARRLGIVVDGPEGNGLLEAMSRIQAACSP